ncbi:LOW QUALITY PROTEIN: hypothetical protein TorRG33x02_028690 [Trema orientale]|uniref:Uncharacterized protein n=1 Tax=Trema orientale TaxID=63057 RepID=A0A2P5FTJ3_TREOI|nr:LOW QUALITY PROTEIN: hypothetical protein TorRG33x02_028690 [Trema orientale]
MGKWNGYDSPNRILLKNVEREKPHLLERTRYLWVCYRARSREFGVWDAYFCLGWRNDPDR